MGAGRRTQTIAVTGSSCSGSGGNSGPPPQRNLGKVELGAVIFGCTNATMSECLSQNLFGLPAQHFRYVKHIEAGMPLFLFNYIGRTMHGIFEATGDGALNINPNAWQSDNASRTQFPAQVKFCVRQKCSLLLEAVFKEAIIDNYFSATHFMFELTHTQKDHLLSLFLQNMQTPLTKSAAPKSAANSMKPGTQKALKKAVEVDNNGWQQKPPTADLGKEWQIKATPKLDTGVIITTATEEEKMEKIQQSGSAEDEMVSADSFYKYSQKYDTSDLYITGSSKDSAGIKEQQPGSYSTIELDKPEQVHALVNGVGKTSNKDFDKAAHHRSILEKLQRLDPSRADVAQESQNSIALEKKPPSQVLDGLSSQADAHRQPWQTEQSEDGNENGPAVGGAHSSSLDVFSNEVAVAVTPMKTVADWERLARDRTLKEQALLREDRDKIWVTVSAFDMNVATALKRNLEVSAAAIAQIRQDGMELHRLMAEVQVIIEKQVEQQKLFENMVIANGMLENTQINMATEIAALKQEINNLRLHNRRVPSSQTGNGTAAETSTEVSSRTHLLGGSAVVHKATTTAFPQREIYILGGLADTWLESMLVYSPATNQMRGAAHMLAPRSYAAASLLDSNIYLYGGGDGSSWSDSAERYSITTGRWEVCAPMRLKRGSLGGATVGSHIYAMGGGNGLLHFNEVECYEPVLGTWIPSTKMLEKRFCVAAMELTGAIYALGGFNGEDYLRSAERFDPREGVWTQIPSMGSKRGSLSAAVLNGKLYALGGFDGTNFLNTVEIFDPRGQAWMPGLSMTSKRAYGAAVVLDDALYVLGGMEDMSQSFTTSTLKIERFVETSGWEDVAHDAIKNRSFVAAAVL